MKKQAASLMTAALLSSTFSGIATADTYTVKKGDTLSRIAITYKTSVSELKKSNKLSSDLIYANQTLTVPSATAALSPVAVKPATAEKAAHYIVKSGDTLSKIASMHKINLADLMNWNGIKGHIIYPGQKLKVSDGTNDQAPPQTTTAKDKPEKTVSPATQVQAPVKNIQAEYIIKSGDTLSKIALQYNMTVKQLKDLNNLTSDLIFAGQKLKVNNSNDQATTENNAAQPVKAENPTVISISKDYMGVPYLWAGSTPDGFDCSGFIYYAYNQAGKQLGRYSSEGYYNRSFYVNEPQPGDLVFFENTYKKGISHVGIYLGNNEFIHASPTGGVMISNLSEAYYTKHFEGFKRFY